LKTTNSILFTSARESALPLWITWIQSCLA